MSKKQQKILNYKPVEPVKPEQFYKSVIQQKIKIAAESNLWEDSSPEEFIKNINIQLPLAIEAAKNVLKTHLSKIKDKSIKNEYFTISLNEIDSYDSEGESIDLKLHYEYENRHYSSQLKSYESELKNYHNMMTIWNNQENSRIENELNEKREKFKKILEEKDELEKQIMLLENKQH